MSSFLVGALDGNAHPDARCTQPITTPGAVQSFGVLLVLEEDYDSGLMSVRQVSEVSLKKS